MKNKKIIILGAGVSGLTAAWHLRKKPLDCVVLEKEPEVGGLCRTKDINRFLFDYDGHLLHFRSKYMFNLVKKLLDNNLVKHQRSAWVYFDKKLIPYPFQANLYGLNPKVVKECLLGLIDSVKEKNKKKKADLNFDEWINYTFGKGIAKHFMLPYNKKFWTVDPKNLTCQWLDNFIPVPTVDQMIEAAVEEKHHEFGYNCRFWYPKKGGINQLGLALAKDIKNIETNCEVVKIDLSKKQVILNSGERKQFDYLISTVPLNKLCASIINLPKNVKENSRQLRYNSIYNINLGINKKIMPEKHWIYFPQKDISFFRVGFFHNFSKSVVPKGKSGIYIEISYSKQKPFNKSKIMAKVKKDLISTGIIKTKNDICFEDINDIEYGYPIYDKNYQNSRDKILQFLKKKNILTCGRYGSWQYMSMEESMLDARNVALSF